MNILDNSLLTTLLTLAATFLGLSVVVQVVQELYKYLRSSKGRAYQQALQDFLGPIATELLRPGVLPDIRVRGPMQLKRVRSKGMILPFKQDELVNALERTAPPWIQKTLEHLNLEVEFQSSNPLPPSANFKNFLEELGKSEQGANGYWNAYEIAEFLNEWGFAWQQGTVKGNTNIKSIGSLSTQGDVDAKQLLSAYRKKFLSHIDDAAQKFPQLEKNFEYSYGRTNRRLTFIIAFLIAIIFNLPINILYQNAQKVDSTEAVKLAQTTMDIYNKQNELPDTLLQENLKIAKHIMSETLKQNSDEAGIEYFKDWDSIKNLFKGDFKFLLYLFYCCITAIFLTFGAPFWNDIASALLRLQKGQNSGKSSAQSEASDG